MGKLRWVSGGTQLAVDLIDQILFSWRSHSAKYLKKTIATSNYYNEDKQDKGNLMPLTRQDVWGGCCGP